MTIFEQYVQAMSDLAGLFLAFRNRHEAPIVKTFLEFRSTSESSAGFFEAIRSVNDAQLCAALDLPLPAFVRLCSARTSARKTLTPSPWRSTT